MRGFEYERLSLNDRQLYDDLLSLLENFCAEIIIKDNTYEHIDEIYRAVLADNPQLFWLSGGSSASIMTSALETVVTFRPKWNEKTISSVLRKKALCLERLVSDIVKSAKRYNSAWEQALYVHDYIIDESDYSLGSSDVYSAYGCLINHKAVCAGYAAAFQLIMNRLSIPCGRISGTKNDNCKNESDHEWNYVFLNGDYYYIDVTWDDPVAEEFCATSQKTHHYFCISDNELCLTHRIVHNGFVPRCVSTKLNYYSYNHFFLDNYSFSALSAIAAEQLKSNCYFTVKFGSKSEMLRAKQDLLDNNGVFRIQGIKRNVSYSISKSGLILTVENS